MLQTAAKGVDSKFGKRRAAIRDTWLPIANSLNHTVTRFVMGKSDDPIIAQKLQREMKLFPDEFLELDTIVRPLQMRAPLVLTTCVHKLA